MATTGRSSRVHAMERWPQIKEPSSERFLNDEGGRKWSTMRRSTALVWGTIPEQGFGELISTIRCMTEAINSMQQRMTRQWREAEDLKDNIIPQRHSRRDQKGYQQDRDAREAPQKARRVEEHEWPVEGGLGHPQQAKESKEMPHLAKEG